MNVVGAIIALWVVGYGLNVWVRDLKKKKEREADERLLERNPEAWERKARVDMDARERHYQRQSERLGGAAKAGFSIARWFLKK